eukprot:10667969-Heterocapsa_arctica.AAC.1
MAVGARKSAPTRLGSYGSGTDHRKMPSWEGGLWVLCCGSTLPRKSRFPLTALPIPMCGLCPTVGAPVGPTLLAA